MQIRIESLALAFLFACGTCTFGQDGQGKDEKPAAPPAGEKAAPKTIEQLSLEELLALGLKNNPDVLVAEAKLREAEAEYNRAKLQLSQKLVRQRNRIDGAKKTLDEAETRYNRMKDLHEKGATSSEDVSSAAATLQHYKAELLELQAEIRYLIGKLPHEAGKEPGNPGGQQRWIIGPVDQLLIDVRNQPVRLDTKFPRGSEADKLRKALDTPVSLNFTTMILTSVLQDFQTSQGISFLINIKEKNPPSVTLKLEKVSLGAALQALEDLLPGLRFTVRDYGILVTYKEDLPANALSVHDFLISDPNGEKPGAADAGRADELTRNAPMEKIDGVVKKVDSGDLILINVGSDAGLAKGHTLEVFRLEPKPMYLGTVRILEVKPAEAVGKVVGKAREPIKEGDRVTSQIVNK